MLSMLAGSISDLCIARPSPSPCMPGNWLYSSVFWCCQQKTN